MKRTLLWLLLPLLVVALGGAAPAGAHILEPNIPINARYALGGIEVNWDSEQWQSWTADGPVCVFLGLARELEYVETELYCVTGETTSGLLRTETVLPADGVHAYFIRPHERDWKEMRPLGRGLTQVAAPIVFLPMVLEEAR